MADPQRTEFPMDQPYEGYVVSRDDPKGLHRVKVRVPGPWDVASPWIKPVGMGNDGAPLIGRFESPPLGANVLIFFVRNNRENPRYLCAGHGVGGVPVDGSGNNVSALTADGDNKVWQDERVRIERDARPGTYGIRVSDLQTGITALELDLAGGQVGIVTPLGIKLQTVGTVRIEGGMITLNGRPVLPGGEAI